MPKGQALAAYQITELDGQQFVGDTLHQLRELYEMEKPKTDEEAEARIDEYFRFCERSNLRPGVGGLAFALGISRITLYAWSEGRGCSARKTRAVQKAKAFIEMFLESAFQSGKINPVSGIFLLKNWFQYRDTVEISTANNAAPKADMSPEEIRQIIETDIPMDTEPMEVLDME